MLRCADAGVVVDGKTLLAGVSADIQPGRVTAILGPNGAGKSTLLSLLTGQRRAHSGEVLLGGIEMHRHTPAALALLRAVMPQESSVAFEFTVREVAQLGRYPHRRQPSVNERSLVMQALAATGVEHLCERVFNTLSGGEKARVHLARALAQVWQPRPDGAPRWLLLDEPTAALDLAHQHQAMRLLRDWAHVQGVGVVAVLHDLNLALRYADDAMVLAAGAPCCFGPTAQVLTAQRISSIWNVQCEPVQGQQGQIQYLFV